MKRRNSLFKIFGFFLVGLSLFIVSCEKNDEIADIPKQTTEPILERALQTDDVQNFNEDYFGRLVTSEAELDWITEDDEKLGAVIIIPIDAKEQNTVSGMMIMYDFATDEFESAVQSIGFSEETLDQITKAEENASPDGVDYANVQFTGFDALYSIDGKVLARRDIVKDQLVSEYEDASRISWWCFAKCLYNKMSWWEKAKCAYGVAKCAVLRNAWTCIRAVIGCVGYKYWSTCYRSC